MILRKQLFLNLPSPTGKDAWDSEVQVVQKNQFY